MTLFGTRGRKHWPGLAVAGALLATPAGSGTPADPIIDARSLLAKAPICGGERPQNSGAEAGASIPMLEGLAKVHVQIATNNVEAQRYFDQGVALTYGFEYDDALKSFRAAQRLDPECVMCAWGEAYALGPYINRTEMSVADRSAARARTDWAMARRGSVKPRDRALIEALHARYEKAGAQSEVHGDRFADAMVSLARRMPDDDFIVVLAAEAIMTAQPWDYWLVDRRTPKKRAGEAISLVETVLARNPDHAQAAHLYIHLTEASTMARRAEPAADRLHALAPGSPHLVHMPSHTYYRIGRYRDAIRSNLDAIASDEGFARALAANPKHSGYFRHHAHFIVSAAEQIGDRDAALAMARELVAAIPAERALKVGYLQGGLAAAWYVRSQFLPAAEFLSLPAPDPRLLRLTATWHALRAEAHGRLADRRGLETELRAVTRLRQRGRFDEPVDRLLRLAAHVARGRLAFAGALYPQAVAHFRAAEREQNGFTYYEPPLWHQPVQSALGAALLKAGDSNAARWAFQRALDERPGNAWALWGLAQAEASAGAGGAARTRATFERTWAGDPALVTFDRL